MAALASPRPATSDNARSRRSGGNGTFDGKPCGPRPQHTDHPRHRSGRHAVDLAKQFYGDGTLWKKISDANDKPTPAPPDGWQGAADPVRVSLARERDMLHDLSQ